MPPLTLDDIRALSKSSEGSRALTNPALREAEKVERSLLERIADIANRPFSAVAGAATGLTGGEDFLELARQGFTGEEQFSSIDVLENFGFDREKTSTKAFGIASDLVGLGLLDPLNVITLGTSKAGRLAKFRGTFPGSRAEAAREGLFGGINVLGKPVLPRQVSGLVARPIDFVGDRVKRSRVGRAFKTIFKNQRDLEEEFPEFATLLKEGRLNDIENNVRWKQFAARLNETHPDAVQRLGMLFIEDPDILERGVLSIPSVGAGGAGNRVRSVVEDEVAKIDLQLERLNEGSIIFPDQIQHVLARDPNLEVAAEVATTQSRLGKDRQNLLNSVEDRKTFLKQFTDPDTGTFIGAAAERTAFSTAAEDLRLMEDQLLELSSRSLADLDPEDMPIQAFQNEVRERLIGDKDSLTDLLRGTSAKGQNDAAVQILQQRIAREGVLATREIPLTAPELVNQFGRPIQLDDDVKKFLAEMEPVRDKIQEVFMSRIRKIDPQAKPPIDNFMTHFIPDKFLGIFRRGSSKKLRGGAMIERVRRELLQAGINDPKDLDRITELIISGASGVPTRGLTARELKGDFDTLLARKLQFPVASINASDLGFAFEDRGVLAANKMFQDAGRWAFAFDAHEFAAKRFGLSGTAFSKLGSAEKKGLVPLDFHVPWVRSELQPFTNGKVYVPKDVKRLMQQFITGSNQITNDAGFRAILDSAHGIRRFWTAWTLAPFPAFHSRNLFSNALLMRLGGLDLKTSGGRESLRAAAETLQHNRTAGILMGDPTGKSTINKIVDELQQGFGDVTITEQRLQRLMKTEQLVQHGFMRDHDFSVGADVISQMGRNQPLPELLRNAVRINPEKNTIIRFMFEQVGRPIEDIPRAALFLHVLKESAGQGVKFETAAANAVRHTRQFLFDPTGGNLSAVENEIFKNLIPFYAWSRNNIPLQIKSLITQPNRFAPLFRAYNGAANSFAPEFEMEDAQDWLRENLGFPIRTVTDPADGTKKVSVWNPQGWIPLLDVNEIADMLRSPSGAGKALFGKLAPWLKEPIEQMLNVDSFREEKIRKGEVKDVFGYTMPDWAAHAVQNVRLFTELDRLNPWGAFTQFGIWRGSFTKDRPHRQEAPGAERFARFMFGFNIYGVDNADVLRRKLREKQGEASRLQSQSQTSYRRGQTAEATRRREAAQAASAEARRIAQRLAEVRRLRSTGAAQREGTNVR